MMATMERKIIQLRTLVCISTSGKNGSEKRMKPYVPIFSKTPARMTEPAVGGSTCPSGSQVRNGNIGTLMANPMKEATNSQIAYWHGISGAVLYSSGMLNEKPPMSVC